MIDMSTTPQRNAAVALVIRTDGLVLCVWNKRYGGWTLPGGRVEPGETIEAALRRELFEQTAITAHRIELVYAASLDPPQFPDRASMVYVYRVSVLGAESRAVEQAAMSRWATRDEFLDLCPFADFYRRMFGAGVDVSPTH